MIQPVVHVGPGIAQNQRAGLSHSVFRIAVFLSSEDAGQITPGRKSADSVIFRVHVQLLVMFLDALYRPGKILHGGVAATVKTGAVLQHESRISHLIELCRDGISLLPGHTMGIAAAGTDNHILSPLPRIVGKNGEPNLPSDFF